MWKEIKKFSKNLIFVTRPLRIWSIFSPQRAWRRQRKEIILTTDFTDFLAGRVCLETFSRWQCHLAQNGGVCFFSRGMRGFCFTAEGAENAEAWYKSEYLNPKQIPITKILNSKPATKALRHGVFDTDSHGLTRI